MLNDVLPADHLRGRVAIVTGAGKGLGRSYALELARCGASVLVNNRIRDGAVDSAAEVVAEINAAGGVAIANRDSVECSDAGKKMREQAMDEFGQLDIVVANAGVDSPKSFLKQRWDDFENIHRINFLGTAQLLHASWNELLNSASARVIVSTSSAGLYGNHGQSAYAASKAALIGLMRSLAIETENSTLRINALAPYAVTPLTTPWFSPAQAQRFAPQSVAKLLCYLVSDSNQLHGQTIIAGGGGVRLAQMEETETLMLEVNAHNTLTKLSSLPKTQAHANASAEFQTFANSLQN